ncbi:lipopolysaccharide core heptose(II) kinase RfaY [Fusobacterium varium]|uniref:lipopolysaccharide core heptose(II) kinase RfaY n=1 Tax=Fusobacterium varium TaxID=856 RepID=UPI003565E96F
MEKIFKVKNNNFNFYYTDEKKLKILEKVSKNNFKIKKEFKNSKRNYVADIVIDNQNYILKDNKNEYKKIFNIIKKMFLNSDGVQILKNSIEVKEEGFNNFAKIIGVVEERKFRILKKSFIIMEKVEGRVCEENFLKDKAIEVVKKLHTIKRYHGDCNPYNFIEEKKSKEIKIIDSKMKKMILGNYRAHYDMLTMQLDSYLNMEYPYSKNMYYYIALAVKKLKKL